MTLKRLSDVHSNLPGDEKKGESRPAKFQLTDYGLTLITKKLRLKNKSDKFAPPPPPPIQQKIKNNEGNDLAAHVLSIGAQSLGSKYLRWVLQR